jgi:hypothetical protein
MTGIASTTPPPTPIPAASYTTAASATEQTITVAPEAKAASETGANSMPADIVELSAEALSMAYSKAYLQWIMGPLYTDDTVAGNGQPFNLIYEEDGVTHINPYLPTGDATAYNALGKAMWGSGHRFVSPAELQAFRDHQRREDEALQKETQALLMSYIGKPQEIDIYRQKLQEIYAKYGRDAKGNRPVDPLQEQIKQLYLNSDAQQGLNQAINLALSQRGISRDLVDKIDVDHVALNGKLLVTFKDGRDPLELDEDYVAYFATSLLQDRLVPVRAEADANFLPAYRAALDKLGLQAWATEGWSVTSDGKFHIFTAYDDNGQERYQDHVIDDPALAAAAIQYSNVSSMSLRLAVGFGIARNEETIRITGYTPPPDGPPVYTDPWDTDTPDTEEPVVVPPFPGESPEEPVETEPPVKNSQETEEEKEKARARRKFLLSMGIRAESDPDANKPDWMSSGEIARLNARYADAMSARDRMIQRFTRKGELEGITDNRPAEISDTA